MMKRITLFLLATLLVAAVHGQEVQGVVTSDNGEPLIGASILEKGTNNGTITDLDGRYQLTLQGTDAVLVFSYTGHQSEEISVAGQSEIDVVLTAGALLNEVVVTGLGITREEKALGYATTTLSAREISTTPMTNFASALYGKAAGVSIRSVPGGATSGVNINIRGFSSITGNTQPLIIMDGVPLRNGETSNKSYWQDQRIRGNGLTDINPEDIASITMLKGASAAALYGSEAVNGVVVITTKKGTTDGFNIDFSANYNTDRIAYLPRYQNVRGPGYPTSLADAGQDANRFIQYDTDGDGVDDIRGLIGTSLNYGPNFDGEPIMAWDGVVRPYSAAGNSYADLFQNASSSSVNLSISQGGERSNVRFSLTRQDNQMISFGSKNERNIASLNTQYKISKRLTTTLIAKFINQHTKDRPYKVDRMINNFSGMMDRFESADWYFDRYKTSLGYRFVTGTNASLTPDENIIYNGFKSDLADYVWRVNQDHSDEKSNRIIANLAQNWEIIDGLNLRGRVAVDYTSLNTENTSATQRPSTLYSNPGGGYSISNDATNQLYGDVMLSYQRKLTEDLDMTLRAGYTAQQDEYRFVSRGTAGGLSPENFFDISASINTPGGGISRTTLVKDAIIGIANVSYKTWLYLEGTLRRDRTSTMSPDNNSFVYPSVNAGFILSDAFDLPRSISYAKVRASFGVVGNYPEIYRANIAYNQNTLNVQANGGQAVLYSNIGGSFGNDLIRPERKSEFEIGLNVDFLTRFNADISYYNGQIIDQILPVDIPRSSGARTVLTNIGTLRNKGLEISLNADIVRKPEFNWSATLNYARNVNVVEKLANNATELLHADFDGNADQIRSVVGQPMGDIYANPIATNAAGEKIVDANG
ncbi:MAG: SusC/RagA family TonB-linked outer membrane protein, partial [Saprospiraceae bacterium]|nr:SusC/RagA family TonB-linked outer membrane protein [Saprospiraceae bacterium]